MIDKRSQKTMFEKDIVNNLFNSTNIYSQINDCEYIYIDDINSQYVKHPIFKNKIILTQKTNDFFMFENTALSKDSEMTKLDYKHIVDLLILNNQSKISQNIESLIDKDTLVIKNLGHNVIYMEDKRKQIKIIITPFEKIVLSNEGIYTELNYYEILN